MNALLAYLVIFPLSVSEDWKPSAWVPVEVATKASFRGISTPGKGVVWISGTEGTVLLSKDDGQSFEVLKVTGAHDKDFRDIWALDAQIAWTISIGPGHDSRIYHTRDGGKTWENQFTNVFEDGFYDGIAFWDDRHGVVYSDPVDGRFLLIFTENGGKRWRRLAPKSSPAALDGEASFAASGTGIITLGKHLWFSTGGARVARVFHSEDRGKSWSVSETPMRAGDAPAGIFSMAFEDEHKGIAVGGHYQKPEDGEANAIYTVDGGKTWKLCQKGPSGYRSGSAPIPSMPGCYVAVGTSGSDYTLDGGKTWLPFDKTNLNVVKFGASRGAGWAAGPDGIVCRLK